MQRVVNYIIIFIIIIAGGLASGLILLNITFKTKEVNVPNLIGMDSLTALRTLNEAQLTMVIVEQQYSLTIAKGHVVSQNPTPGRRVKKKKNIKVVLSLGGKELAAPKLAGISLREAKMEISQRGLKLEKVALIHDGENLRDTVIAQTPPSGELLEREGRISLLVSAGNKPQSYIMPDLIGKDIKEVAALLERMGVGAGSIEYREYKGFPPGIVIKQDPVSGYIINRGAQASITLSGKESGASSRTGSFSMFRYRLPEDGPSGRVKIVVENESEVKEVYNATRGPGFEVQILVKIEGATITRVYFNNELVLEKRF